MSSDGAHAIRLTIPAKAEYITLGRLALTGIARLRTEPMAQEVLGELEGGPAKPHDPSTRDLIRRLKR